MASCLKRWSTYAIYCLRSMKFNVTPHENRWFSMKCKSTSRASEMLCSTLTGLAIVFGVLTTVSAQYHSSYPYSRAQPSRTQLPNTARHIGGFTGNPYRTSTAAPTGLPVSRNINSYYGGVSGNNSLGYKAPTKPFANLHRPQPLVSGVDAARIEIARGLWRY